MRNMFDALKAFILTCLVFSSVAAGITGAIVLLKKLSAYVATTEMYQWYSMQDAHTQGELRALSFILILIFVGTWLYIWHKIKSNNRSDNGSGRVY